MRQNLIALVTVTLLAGGCASGNEYLEEVTPTDDRTTISITNHNWSDMTIYLIRDGSRQRLGLVPSQATQNFRVPTYLVSTSARVHLMADPIGSPRTFVSPPLLIGTGQAAEWRLENSLALSSVWVR